MYNDMKYIEDHIRNYVIIYVKVMKVIKFKRLGNIYLL